MDKGGANKIPFFPEELLAVGLLRERGDIFLSGVGTGKLLMLLKSSSPMLMRKPSLTPWVGKQTWKQKGVIWEEEKDEQWEGWETVMG